MKTKLCWICLFMVAAGFIVAGGEYIAKLNDRTRVLEARLARVEAEVNSTHVARAQVVTASLPWTHSGWVSTFQMGVASPGGAPHETLESRVEKIEQELKPHLELLAVPTSDAQGDHVRGSLQDAGVQDRREK